MTDLLVRVLLHIGQKHSVRPFIQEDYLLGMAGGTPACMDALVVQTIHVTVVHLGIVYLPVGAVVSIKVIQTTGVLQSLTARCTRLLERSKAIANWTEMIQSISPPRSSYFAREQKRLCKGIKNPCRCHRRQQQGLNIFTI